MVPIVFRFSILFLSISLMSHQLFGKDVDSFLPEYLDPSAVEAYQGYWRAFEVYEKNRQASQREELRQSLVELDEKFNSKKYVINENQLNLLVQALEHYRNHLTKFPGAQNTPVVMLNAAQILSQIGDFYFVSDRSLGITYKQQALEYLSELKSKFPNFQKQQEALYLSAMVMASLGDEARAQQALQELAKSETNKIVVLYANLAVGDYHFDREKAELAYAAYKKAMSIYERNEEFQDYPKLKIDYRLAWSSYRSANLKDCVTHSVNIVRGHPLSGRIKIEDGFRSDAVDLLSDALFELNDTSFTKRVLHDKVPKHLGASVVLGIMKRYLAAGIYEDIIALGEYAVANYPTATDMPDILTIVSDSFKKLGNEAGYLSTLELLAMMLPSDSLWRMRNKALSGRIDQMQDKAVAASTILAAKNYQKGMLTRSLSYFNRASNFYDLLIEFSPSHKDMFDWKVKRANCAYFAGNLNEADEIYGEIKESVAKNSDLLLMAYYQQVMTREKMWRQSLEENVSSKSPSNNPIVIERLRYFENSIEEFANKFPDNSRSVDLLLTAAAANYDLNKAPRAARYWQRVLVSRPSRSQREMAIRGIVAIQIDSDDYEQNIKVVRRFVDLESSSELNDLRTDLLKILADQVQKNVERLNKKGEYKKSADLLVSELQVTNGLPGFEKSWRDAGYYYAMGLSWKDSLKVAEDYLTTSLSSYRADMIYLKAKSLEYLLKFDASAKSYVELARAYPDHPKSDIAAKRAFSLANSSDDFSLAAKALDVNSGVRKSESEQADLLLRSADLYAKHGDYGAALDQYSSLAASTKDIGVRYRSQLDAELSRYKNGDESTALNNIRKLLKKVIRDEDKLSRNNYRNIVSKGSLFLAQDIFEKFHGFSLASRGNDLSGNIKYKLKIFDDLSDQLDIVLKLKSPDFLPKARFQLGFAAESLADEISSIRLSEYKLSNKAISDLGTQTEKLRGIAKRYYVANINLSNMRPDLYSGNTWIYQSKIKISTNLGKDLRELNDQVLPFSLSDDFPYRWSY